MNTIWKQRRAGLPWQRHGGNYADQDALAEAKRLRERGWAVEVRGAGR